MRMTTLIGVLALAAAGSGPTARALDRDGGPGVTPAWEAPLAAMEEALARGDVAGAARSWQEAYVAALGSWRWDGLVAVAEACLELTRGRHPALGAARARQLYLAAFFRARQQGSVEGLLRAAEGFGRLGDHEAAQRVLRLAERAAASTGDATDRARVRHAAERLAGPAAAVREGAGR